MAKPAKEPKAKPKSLKEQKKELEDRLFGEKNSAKKKELQALIKKIEVTMRLEAAARAKEEEARRKVPVRQIIPVGVDPKTIMCANFLNNNCDKGDRCQFAHEAVKAAAPAAAPAAPPRPKMVCRFLVDALNSGEYTKNWACPLTGCTDVHRLIDIGGDASIEVSLEEYIELQRQTLDETALTPVTEESFNAWRAQKDREEAQHAQRVAALASNARGIDLFFEKPDMFEDDEGAGGDINYAERDYAALDSEEEAEGLASPVSETADSSAALSAAS